MAKRHNEQLPISFGQFLDLCEYVHGFVILLTYNCNYVRALRIAARCKILWT